jgi:hypothetical protein
MNPFERIVEQVKSIASVGEGSARRGGQALQVRERRPPRRAGPVVAPRLQGPHEPDRKAPIRRTQGELEP